MILVFLYFCYIGCLVKKLIPKFYRTAIVTNKSLKFSRRFAAVVGVARYSLGCA